MGPVIGLAGETPDHSFAVIPELTAGFDLLYEQKFAEAREVFASWESCNSEDPFGEVAVAASYLFEEVHLQGVLTSDFFLNEKGFLRGIDGRPDPERMRHFRKPLARARDLARERQKTRGKACVRGMRVTVGMIVGQIGAGHTMDELLSDYPYLEREDILQALRYAAWLAEEREGTLPQA